MYYGPVTKIVFNKKIWGNFDNTIEYIVDWKIKIDYTTSNFRWTKDDYIIQRMSGITTSITRHQLKDGRYADFYHTDDGHESEYQSTQKIGFAFSKKVFNKKKKALEFIDDYLEKISQKNDFEFMTYEFGDWYVFRPHGMRIGGNLKIKEGIHMYI
jgi:hypothetical protein